MNFEDIKNKVLARFDEKFPALQRFFNFNDAPEVPMAIKAFLSYSLEESLRAYEESVGGYSEGMRPDWSGKCDVCGASPIMPVTGMCGPCSTGEAETINGNW